MCDICGFIATPPVSASTILSMTNLARHRGPDDEGYLLLRAPDAAPELFGGPDTPAEAYRSGAPFAPSAAMTASDQPVTLAFGHRRLSILDLSVLGHQPMCTNDRRYWIVYNGEIYNYSEIAEELKALGHRFLSHSDTEVILAAYATWGADSLHKLNGMFAFAIYDAQAATLFSRAIGSASSRSITGSRRQGRSHLRRRSSNSRRCRDGLPASTSDAPTVFSRPG